jgi:protein-glutamine gamma-glutamyltransferase
MVKEVRSPDALDFERKMRDSIVESAEALNNSGADFATFDESRCNPQFWTRTDIGGLQLNAGVTPSMGIKDIFQNGHLYAFECATAMVIVMYRATIEAIGEEAFNRYFKDLFLWDWNYDENLRLITNYNKDQMQRADIVYFRNPDHAPSKPEWQGENAVMLGGDLFYGHGIGITTAEIIIDSLNEERVPGSNISAFLTNESIHPDFNYLQSLSTGSVLPMAENRSLQYTVFSRIGARSYIYKI